MRRRGGIGSCGVILDAFLAALKLLMRGALGRTTGSARKQRRHEEHGGAGVKKGDFPPN
jgi:hypothetical protein